MRPWPGSRRCSGISYRLTTLSVLRSITQIDGLWIKWIDLSGLFGRLYCSVPVSTNHNRPQSSTRGRYTETIRWSSARSWGYILDVKRRNVRVGIMKVLILTYMKFICTQIWVWSDGQKTKSISGKILIEKHFTSSLDYFLSVIWLIHNSRSMEFPAFFSAQ